MLQYANETIFIFVLFGAYSDVEGVFCQLKRVVFQIGRVELTRAPWSGSGQVLFRKGLAHRVTPKAWS